MTERRRKSVGQLYPKKFTAAGNTRLQFISITYFIFLFPIFDTTFLSRRTLDNYKSQSHNQGYIYKSLWSFSSFTVSLQLFILTHPLRQPIILLYTHLLYLPFILRDTLPKMPTTDDVLFFAFKK